MEPETVIVPFAVQVYEDETIDDVIRDIEKYGGCEALRG